jgi:hypothetical protein
MLYRKITLWTHKGQIWIAHSAENGRDMSMGVYKPWEVARVIAWAKSHNLTIQDDRRA